MIEAKARRDVTAFGGQNCSSDTIGHKAPCESESVGAHYTAHVTSLHPTSYVTFLVFVI